MANEQEPFPWEDNYGADKPPWEDNYDTSAPFDAGPPSGVLRRGIADPLVGLAKGTLVGIPEAGYGLANLATGGLVGRGVEALNEATGAGTPASGFKMANEAFDSMLSPETQAAKQRVAEAEGFLPTLGAYAQNPSAIVQGITENVPGMFAMRGIGKAALGLAGKPVLQREAMATALEAAGGAKSAAGKALIAQNAARAATGAGIGEGAYTAGQNITQVMEQTGTDIMEPKSLLYNATAGMITGIISKLSGTLANKLGFTDIDVMMQGVAAGDFGKPMGILKTLFASAITEGLFEELPQSAQEQYFQNLSMGKADPWEGVAEAAASGLVIGAFMGLGGSTAAALRSHIDPTNRKIEDEINRLAEEVKTQSSFFGDTDEFDIESVVNDTQLNALSQDWNVFANNGLYYWSNKTNPAQSGVQKPEELSEEELRDWQGLARSTAQQTNLLDRAQKGDLEAQKALEESGVDWKPATQMDKVRADYREAMGENYNKSAEEVGLIDKIQNLDFTLGHPAIIDREFAKLSPKKQKALPGTSIAQKREAYKREIENERLAALDKIQEGQKKRDIKYQPRAASKAIILKDEQGKPLPELESARPDGRNNDTKFVKTPSQEKIKFKYHFIEAANLQPSHDRYGRENLLNTELDAQQRDRANKDSLAQIEKISNTLDFEEAAENYLSGFGAPLGVFNTAGDGNFSVISGTGRGAGIKYAYDVDKSKLADKKGFYEGAPLLGQKYKDDAIAAASRFGYTPEEVAAMNQPVLVREILTPVDRLELSRSTNISVTADRSDIEVGREDAQNMTPAMMHQFVLNADGSLNVAQSKDGIQNFRNIMAQRGEVNQGAYFTDEVPTDKFVKRILTAMFINAFEDDKLAFHIVNEENKTMNSVVRAMATVSDDYMALNEVAKDNPLNPIKDLVAAARIVRWAHEHNSTVPMAVNQPSLIDKDMTPEASMLAVAFGELSGEARNLRKMMNVLASSTKVEVANQGQFALPGVIKAKSKVELINDAILSVGLSISVSKQGSYQAVRFEPTSIENVEASAKAAEDEESSVNLAAPATPEQNYAWIKAWKSFRDVKARDNLIKHNARFVYGLAHTYKKYFPDADNKKAAFADLVQEGNIGLVEALDKYDLTAKTAFLTYAGWKVEANMQSYVQKNMGIVAEGKDVASRKYFRSLPGTMRALWQSVNLAGTESERSMLIEAAQSLGINDEQLARLRGRDESLSPVKTDEFDADEGTSNKAALSAASLLPAGETPESVMVGNEIHQLAGTIGSALSELDTTEKYIITNRILAEEPLTQSQIGLKFNMTKQRVGQIEKEALAKLKNKLAPMIREGAYEQRTIRKTGSGRDNGSVAEGRKGRHDRELAVEEREILKRSHKFNAELVQRIREEQRVTKFLKLLGIKRRGATAKAVERAYQNMLKMVNRSIPVNEETRPLLMQLQRGQVWDGGVYKSDLFNEENWEALDVKVGRDDTLLKRNRIIPELNLFKKLVDNGILTKDQVLTFLNTGGLKNLSLFKDGTEVEPILDIDKVSPARLERGGWRTMTEAEEAALVAQLEDVADKGEYPTTYRVLNKKTGKYENIPFPPLKSYLSGITEAGLRKEYDHYLATGLEKTLEIDEARYDDRSYLDSFELGRQYNMDVVPLKINKFVNALLLKYTDGSGTVFLARYGDIAVNFTGHEISEAKKTGPKGENNVQTRLHINRDSAAFGEYHAELTAALGHEVEVEYALKEMAADLQGGLLVNYGVILHNAVYHGQKIDYIVTPNRTAVREMKGAIPSFKGEAEAAQALIREHNTTPMKFGQAVDEYQRVTGAVFPYPAIIPLLDKMGTSVVYNKSPRTYFDKESNTIFIGSRIALDTEASTKQPMLPGMPQRGRAPQRHKTMTGQTSLAGVPQQVKRTASPHSKIYPNLTQTALDLVTEPRKALPIQVVGQSKEGYMDILYDGKRLYRERIDAALHDKINSLLKNQNFKRAGEIISRNRDKDYVAPTVLTEEQKQKGLTEVRKIIDMLDTEASTKQQPVLPGLEKKQKFQPRPRTKNISQATLPGMAKETPPTKHVYDASKYNERQLQPSLNFEAPTDLELAGFADTEASVAWHGGFDWKPEAGFPHGRPRLDKVGTGEGAAVFSWGFYSAMLKAVAQEYYNGSVGQRFGASRGLTEALFETLSRRSEKRDAVIVKGKSYTRKEFMHAIDTADLYMDDFKLDDIHAARKLLGNPSLYKMDIPDDVDPKLLQWDMPTYRQTDYVQNILDKLGVGNVPSGSVLYGRVGEALVHPDESLDDSAKKIIKQYPNADWKELASRWLASHGIAGNKYEDQGSRYRGIVVMPKTGDWFFISGYRHDEHSITYDEWLNQTIEYDKEMYKDAKYYVIGTDEFIKARDFVENAEDYDDTNSIIDELNNEQMMNVLGITGEKQTLLPWGEKKKPLQSFLSLQDALDNLSKTASYNTVIWDQATLDRIILLEKNGKMLDAVQEYTGSRLVQDTEASVRPSKDRDSSELLGQALAIAGTEATIHHTLKSTSNLKYNSQHGLVNRGVVSLSLRNDLKKLYDNLAPYRNLTETTPEGKGWAEAKLIYDRIGKEGMESFPKYAFHSRAFAAWLNSIPDFERKRNAEYYEALDRANPTLWSKYRNVMLRMLGRVEKTERTKLDVIRDIMDRWVDVDLAKELSQYTVQIETDVARRFPKMMDYMRETNTPYPFGKVFEYTEEFMNKLPESQRNPDYIGLKVKRFKTGKGDTYIYEPIDMKNYVINRRKREYTDAVVARKGNLPRFITLSGGVKIGTQGLADEYTKTPVVNRGSVNWVSLRKRQIAEHKKVRNMSPEDRARYLRAYEVRLFGRGWEKESLYHGYRRRMAIWLSAMGAGKKNYEIMNNVAQILEAERRAIQSQPTQAQRFAEATQGVPKDVLLTRDASGISMRRGINWKMGEQKVTKGLYVGQYQQPSLQHWPVSKYYSPDEFAEFKEIGYAKDVGTIVTEKVPEGLEEVAKSKFAAAQNVQRGPTEKTAVAKKELQGIEGGVKGTYREPIKRGESIKRQNRKRATGPSGLTYGLYEIVTKPEKIPYTTSNTFSVTQNGKDVGKVTMEPYGEVGIDGQKHQVMMIHDWTIDTLKSTRATLSKIFNDNPNISLIAAADISKEFTNYIVLSGGRISYTDGGRIAYITKDMRSDRIKRDSAVRQETLPLLSADQMSEIDEWNIATEARARREQINKNIEAKQIWLRRADELGVDEDLSDNQRIAQAVKIQNERRRDAVRGIRDDAFWLREANKQGIDKTLPEATRIEEAKVDYVETEPMQEGLFGGETPVSQLKAPRRTSMKTGKKQPKMQNRSIFDTEASVRDALFSIADNIPVKLPRSAAIQEFLRGGLLNVPTEEMDKFEQTAEQYGGIKNRTIRKIFSLPHANAKKHADWKTAFTSVMRMMDNKQRLEHEWLRKANVAINRRLYLKKDGYTNEQIAELDDKLASLLSLGDERLRDKSIAMMNQIKSMEKAPLLYSEEDIAPFRERFERMTKRNGYSYAEAVEQGIKDDDGNIVKLKDEKEYAIYHAITSTVRDVFDKQIQYLKDNALSQHETKAWYKLLTLALGERVTNETLDSIAGGLKTAVSNRTKVAVELKNLFSRINKNFDSQGVMDLGNSQRDQLRLLQSELDVLENTKQNDAAELVRRQIAKLEKELVGVTQKEGDEVMKRYTKIAETSRQELEALRTYISAVTGITKEEEVEKLTREMFKAYQMTRPLMKRITDMKAEINQWVGFFPRIRHDGKWKMALYELYRDPKSGATKRKEVFSDFFTSDAEFNEVYGRAMNDFGKGGIFPEKYVTEYTPNKKETGIAYGDSTPSDMKLQKVLENSINSLNIEGNVFDENGKPIDLKRSLIEESFNAVSAQLLDRGAARHRIHRKQKVGQKAIKGYNETEFDKVLLNYITTMAGSLSKQQGAMDAMEILNNLKDKTLWPELKDYFSSMLRSDTKADRVSGQLRSFAFIWYLGLMVKSGFVNSTQPYIVGIPQLTNWMQGHGMKGRQAYPVQLKATADIARNFVKLIRKDPSEWGNLDGMTETEQRYLSEGLITGKMAAQQVRYIKGAASGWGKLKNDVFDIMAAPFAMVEIFNRLCSGLAMYRVAENYHTNHRGKEDDYESIFENAGIDADEFINNVHYPIGRHNRPSFMQSGDTVGATAETLYVFRTFTHNFLLGQFNLLRSGISDIRSDDKAKRAQASHDLLTVVHTMALLGLFGGLLGLPFFKDLFDWWEKEYGESPKLWLRETLNDLGGNTLENLGMNGLPAVLGGNISGSLAIGVPFISDKNELDSVFGVWGGLKEKAKRSASAFARGDVYRGVTNLTPEFLRGPIVALTESSFGESLGGRGLVTTASGMPVYSSTGEPLRMTAGESAIKALGFQPTRITKEREVEWSVKNTVTWANEQKRILTESYRIDRLQNKSGALKDLMNGIRELNAEIKDRKIPTPLAKVSTVVKNSRAKKTKQQLREIRAREAILQQ